MYHSQGRVRSLHYKAQLWPVCLLLFLPACATLPAPEARVAGSVAELEAVVARDRNDVNARVQLAAAYVQAGRNQESAALLEPLATLPQAPPTAAYFLGLSYEGLERLADARRQYNAYLQRGTSDALKRNVQRRLALLDRRELEAAVRNAIAQERTLATTTPAARVVGVFPFLNGAGQALAPLSRALAELLSVDLNQTGRLTVVERSQVQRLLDEIRLGQSGSVDPQTAARAGRLLGAGRIVQGRIDGTDAALRIQAMVVPVGTGAVQGTALGQQGALRQLFTMQTELALSVHRALGVELTVAERERVMRQPTQNVQALLAFGMGLEAEDNGRYAEAIAQYRRAQTLDPFFAEAASALQRSEAKSDGASQTPAVLALEAVRDLPPVRVQPPPSVLSRDRFSGVESLVPSPVGRDPVPELLGTEGFDRRSILNILIRRPQ